MERNLIQDSLQVTRPELGASDKYQHFPNMILVKFTFAYGRLLKKYTTKEFIYHLFSVTANDLIIIIIIY